MTHFALLLFLFLFGLPVPLYAAIEVIHDRFTGSVIVRTKPTAHSRIALVGVYDKEGQPEASIQVYMQATSWRYLTCHQTYWLVDDKSFQLPQPTHKGNVGSGYVLEILSIKPVSLEQIYQLGMAKKIEFKVCSDEYQANVEEMNDLRTFLLRMRENAPKKSP